MSAGPLVVLDTHAAIQAQLMPEKLGRAARKTIANLPPAGIAISDVTLTETARLLIDRRIVVGGAGPDAWLEAFGLCFNIIPVTPRVAWMAAAFDWRHRDPCDRQILATAVVLDLPLITVDPAIKVFAGSIGVRIIW